MSLGEHMAAVRALHARALDVDLAGDAAVVHDLRVALRRCRSLAQGLADVDLIHRADWRGLAGAARGLFDGLGALRDAQVMCDWARLVPDDHRAAVDARLQAPLAGLIGDARAALQAFDIEGWDRRMRTMPLLAEHALRRRPLLLHLALARFDDARALHVIAMRRRDPESLHRTRVGVKRLRYTLESLLPDLHARVAKPLKKMQEALGDLHDLDVLGATLADVDSAALAAARSARAERLAAYKAMATGRGAWTTIRRALPPSAVVIERCRRAYVLELAASLGVDERRARRAERGVRALAATRGVPLASSALLASVLAPAKRRPARRAIKGALGLPAVVRRAVRDALDGDALVDAVRRVDRAGPPPRP
ncbi:MAG: CHAD domain-containing protein [Deltaproteobacteria bacterium]|nr:CHAD domain-containing protein [Deltaproteobacteria bacterium]